MSGARGSSERRVLVTALGAVTAIGASAEAFWEALLAGRTGIAPVTGFDVSRFAARCAAEVHEVPEDERGEAVERAHRLALAGASEALAGVPFGGERSALVVGTTLGGNTAYTARLARGGGEARELSRSTIAAGTALLARRFGALGPALTVSVACASGTAAIGLGAELIRRGEADQVLAGGYDALSEFVFSGFDTLKALSTTRVRPFDRRRDGLGLGEGAAFLLLEEAGLAERRGARPRAEILGYGSAADAHHMTRPSPGGEGVKRAVQAALCDARLLAERIGFISAHGTATVFNDRMESAAFGSLLGERVREVPVNSIKGAVGHTLGAAGALEALMATFVLERGVVPPTAGFEEPDAECALDVVTAPRRVDVRAVLSTSSAFAGTNAALVLGAP